jgi:RimJ/RimL family protein N-acetyltransferase
MTGSALTVTTYTDPNPFLAAAGRALEAMPVESNVIATLTADVLAGTSPYRQHLWFTVHRTPFGHVIGLAKLTEWGLATTPLLEPDHGAGAGDVAGDVTGVAAAAEAEVGAAAAAVVAAVRAHGVAVPRVSGVGAMAPAVVRALTADGAEIAQSTTMLVYDLVDLLAPEGVPGHARPAGPDDLDRVTRWLFAFHDEVEHGGRTDGLRRHAETTVAQECMMLWIDEDRAVVSMAGVHPPALGLSRVGPVYTPPELRRRGYAGAVTAAATRRGFDLGATRTMLFTDADFPTSNHIYQQLGYRQVGEAIMVVLGE